MPRLNQFKLFDSHLHIIDKQFPLVSNNGYLPNDFSADDYQQATQSYQLEGGAIVSGSFQAFDQTYLLDALKKLGKSFVGVTQLPVSVSDDELIRLHKTGIRAVRFNLKRGGSETVENLDRLARRVYETVGWHSELYIDSANIPSLFDTLSQLPKISIDHLGLSKSGLPHLYRLLERGAHVKATGFGRIDFDAKQAIKDIVSINPNALMFGTDLPSTRATRPYRDTDFLAVAEQLDEQTAQKVFYDNAINLYK